MAIDLHTISLVKGSNLLRPDRLIHGQLINLANLAGNGDPASIGVGTPGAGYATIPTVAFATAGTGASATAAALMGVVVLPTIAAAGSGGTNGAVTLTGTTGTGTKFQLTGTIAGGVLTAISAISVAGSYSALPATLAAEPVTGGSLTGTTVNLSAAMGVIGYTVSSGSSNHQYPNGTTAALTGGAPTTAAVPGAVVITTVAGQPVTISVAFSGNLPSAYGVWITPNQDVTFSVSSKTAAGFSVTFNPRLAANSVAAGTFDVLLTA